MLRGRDESGTLTCCGGTGKGNSCRGNKSAGSSHNEQENCARPRPRFGSYPGELIAASRRAVCPDLVLPSTPRAVHAAPSRRDRVPQRCGARQAPSVRTTVGSRPRRGSGAAAGEARMNLEDMGRSEMNQSPKRGKPCACLVGGTQHPRDTGTAAGRGRGGVPGLQDHRVLQTCCTTTWMSLTLKTG